MSFGEDSDISEALKGRVSMRRNIAAFNKRKTSTYQVKEVKASSTLISMATNLIVGMVALSSWLTAYSATVGLSANKDKVAPVVALKAEPFPLQNVRLLEGPFQHAMELDHTYLLSLDAGPVAS